VRPRACQFVLAITHSDQEVGVGRKDPALHVELRQHVRLFDRLNLALVVCEVVGLGLYCLGGGISGIRRSFPDRKQQTGQDDAVGYADERFGHGIRPH